MCFICGLVFLLLWVFLLDGIGKEGLRNFYFKILFEVYRNVERGSGKGIKLWGGRRVEVERYIELVY